MSCRFKNPENPAECMVTHGECQFLEGGYDDECPILHAFEKLNVEEKIGENK